MDGGLVDHKEDCAVQVAHISASNEPVVQKPMAEILALQEADPEVGQILKLGNVPGYSVPESVFKGIDRFTLFDSHSLMWMYKGIVWDVRARGNAGCCCKAFLSRIL